MLQNPARPSGNVQLPYTTADMAERLAKKKAAKDRQDILDSLSGGLSYGQGGVDITPQLSQVGGMVKGLIQMPAATVMDVVSGIVRPLDKYVGGVKDPVDQFRPEDYGTSNLITGTAQGLEQAGRRAVGDITAIPRVGKPSASPTATDIKRLGVIEGLSKAGIDYGNLALTAAPFVKPSAFGISNAYQDMVQARIARQNRSPFPTVKTPGAFIDVDALQGSRLPARIVDTPATPATRLAEAQTQRALPPAQVAPIEVAPTTSRLTPPPFRERKVPTSSRLTVETDGPPDPQVSQEFVIRAFDNTSDQYKGALTMYWDPIKQKAIVYGMGATNAMVTPQLVSSAAYIIRKYYGDIQFPLEPARNLSAYSRPFVERLQKAGLVDPDFVLPKDYELNSINKDALPDDFANEFSEYSEIIPSLAYQPTYNNVLKALVESKRQAKLQGEYGKLATSSQKLQTMKEQRQNLNNAVSYRANMEQFGFPVHPLFEQASDARINLLLDQIKYYPSEGADMLISVWDKLDPALVENAGVFADSYALTRENLLKFPQLLQDANLIDGQTRQRLLNELVDLITKETGSSPAIKLSEALQRADEQANG